MTYEDLTDLTDKTLEEVVNQLDDFFEIYRYENDLLGNKAAIKATDLYLSQNLNKIRIGATITSGLDGLTVTGGKTLNEYLDIKDNHPIERINDLIQLKYDTNEFQTGPDPAYKLELKMVPGNKVDVLDNAPLQADTTNNKLFLKYDDTTFQKGILANKYQLELKDNGVKASKIDIVANRPIYNNTTNNNQLDIRYNTDEFNTDATYKLEIKKIGGNKIDILANEPLNLNTGDNKLMLKYNNAIFQKGTTAQGYWLELKDQGIKADKIDIVDNRPIYSTANKQLDFRFNTNEFEIASSATTPVVPVPLGLQLKSSGIKAHKLSIEPNRPIYSNSTNNLDFKYNTNEFQLMEATANPPYGLELKKVGASKIEIDSTTTVTLGPRSGTDDKLDVKFNAHSGLEATSTGIKINLLGSATTNDSGLLLNTTTKEGLHINLPSSSGLKIDATGLKVDLPLSSGLKIDSTGLKIDLATSGGLSIDATGLGISSTYKTELQNLKTQAETAKTQAETAKIHNVLFNGVKDMCMNKGFRVHQNEMITYIQQKKGLSYVYDKRKVLEDGVSTVPLDI